MQAGAPSGHPYRDAESPGAPRERPKRDREAVALGLLMAACSLPVALAPLWTPRAGGAPAGLALCAVLFGLGLARNALQ